MDNIFFNQTVKRITFAIIGSLTAMLLGICIGANHYELLAVAGATVILCYVVFLPRDAFWILTIASSFLSGTFPILGGSFTPFQMLMTAGVIKFVIEEIVLKRTRIQKPEPFDMFMIFVFMGIILLHGLHDRFGMRFLGSTIWGGRDYIYVFTGFAAFFIAGNLPANESWRKLPYVVLAVASFDPIIAIVTTIFPSSIFVIYPFYSAVSRTGVEEIVTGSASDASRLTSVGAFGVVLIAFILASAPLGKILHPSNLSRLGLLACGFIITLYSSFRSTVFSALGVLIAASIRDLKARVLLLVPVLCLIFFGLSVVNTSVVPLPREVQRSLTFLPGKWDSTMQRDATSSNDFRRQIWTLWEREFFPVHPWIGRGFGFKSEWASQSVMRYDPNADQRMVEIGNIHNGFLSSLDTFGIIGSIFFILWNLSLLVRIFRVRLVKDDPKTMVIRFLAFYLGGAILFYWIGAPGIGTFLPQEFALAGVFLRLCRSDSSEIEPRHLPNKVMLSRAEAVRA